MKNTNTTKKNAINKEEFFQEMTHRGVKSYAHQALSAMSCIIEVIDNAVTPVKEKGAEKTDMQICVCISVAYVNGNIRFVIADNGPGMDRDTLRGALNFGSMRKRDSRLSEYGVGLNNAIQCSTCSSGKFNDWLIATRLPGDSKYHVAEGPFYEKEGKSTYSVADYDWNDIDALAFWDVKNDGQPSTAVMLDMDPAFVSTMLNAQNQRKTKNLSKMAPNIILRAIYEECGILYRELLKLKSKRTNGALLNIKLLNMMLTPGAFDSAFVQPIEIPMDIKDTINVTAVLYGKTHNVRITTGFLNEELAKKCVNGTASQRNYHANKSESGAEITIDDIVIARHQMSRIWDKECHEMYNHIQVSVVVDGSFEHGQFASLNNKSDIDETDSGWWDLFEIVRKNVNLNALAADKASANSWMKNELTKMQARHEANEAEWDYTRNMRVWGCGSLIAAVEDHTVSEDTTETTFYMVKNGILKAEDVAKMFDRWDGLFFAKRNVVKGILVCDIMPPLVKQAMGDMLRVKRTPHGSHKYNFEIIETGKNMEVR